MEKDKIDLRIENFRQFSLMDSTSFDQSRELTAFSCSYSAAGGTFDKMQPSFQVV